MNGCRRKKPVQSLVFSRAGVLVPHLPLAAHMRSRLTYKKNERLLAVYWRQLKVELAMNEFQLTVISEQAQICQILSIDCLFLDKNHMQVTEGCFLVLQEPLCMHCWLVIVY